MQPERNNLVRTDQDRLTVLENECRRLRTAFQVTATVALFAIGAAILMCGSREAIAANSPKKTEDEIRSKKFIIVDEKGRSRIELSVIGHEGREKNMPSIRLLDEKGLRKAELCAHPEQTSISLYSSSGESLVDLLLSDDKRPTIQISNQNSMTARLTIEPSNRTSLSIGGNSEIKAGLSLGLLPEKGVLANVTDDAGNDRVTFSSRWDKSPLLRFFDAAKKEVGKLP